MARGTTVTLRKSTARLNPQDLSAITCWIGCTSKGTVNVMQTLTQTSSMRSTVGYGPAASGAAECLNIGGAPVYITPSAQDTPGVIGTVTKTTASGGVAFAVYGSKGWVEVRDKTHPERPTGHRSRCTVRGTPTWPPRAAPAPRGHGDRAPCGRRTAGCRRRGPSP